MPMHPKPMTPTSGPVLPNVVVRMLFSLSVTCVGRGLSVVFLIGDEDAPLGLRAMGLAEAFPHGDVGHEVVGGGAVPVPLAGRGVDGVARADLGDLAAAGLDQSAASVTCNVCPTAFECHAVRAPGEADDVHAHARGFPGLPAGEVNLLFISG